MRLILTVSLFVLLIKQSVIVAAYPIDWDAVNTSLVKHQFTTYDFAEFRDVKQIRDLYEMKSSDILWNMLGQRQRPFVELAGFVGLREMYRDEATDAALALVFGPSLPMELRALPYEFLARPDIQDGWVRQLTLIGRTHVGDPHNWSLLISIASHTNLYNWINLHGQDAMDIDQKAVILDEVFSNPRLGESVTPMMRKLLDSCRFGGGPAMLVYVHNCDPKVEGFKAKLISVLTDPELSDSEKMVVLSARKSFVLSQVEWRNLHLSERLRGYLERASSSSKPSQP